MLVQLGGGEGRRAGHRSRRSGLRIRRFGVEGMPEL
jgi:hypothetical protein